MSAMGYLAASILPRTASAGSAVALPILAVQQLDNVGIGGVLVAASLGPSVLAAPAAGAALDRARRPGILVAAAGLLTAAALAVTAFLGQVPLPLIVVSLALAGAASPFYMGGLSSFVSGSIPDVRRAFAYDSLSYNFSAVAGPAFVAVMATFLPAAVAVGALSTAAVVGALIVGGIGLKPHRATGVPPWHAIKAGLHRIFRHRPLAVVTASSTLTQFGQGGLAIAAVALSIERTGAPGEGAVIVTAFAIGSLVGALIETVRPSRRPPHRVMMVGFFVTGLFTAAAALNLGIIWTVLAIGASGVFTAASAAAMLTLRSRLSPPHLRSQIFTVGAGLRTSASAAGAGLAASATGLGGAVAVAVIGIIWILSAAAIRTYPKETS